MKKLIIALLLAAAMLFGAAALAESVVLPDPAYYFGKTAEYDYDAIIIMFDAYPEAEYDAYTTPLVEKYGMDITISKEDEDMKFCCMIKPGVDGSQIAVDCLRESDSEQYIAFRCEENISLEKLDVYTVSSTCDLCGGDGVCDTCGGKGYLEMKAYGSNETVRIACTGGCADGQCTACGGEQTTSSYTPPIVGNNGLLVMSPEQYLGIEPCNGIYADNGCYVYKYDAYGSDEKWAIMKSYVQALVDSGYYEISNHSKSSTSENFELRYIGPAEIVRGSFDIKVRSYVGFCNVRWRISNNVAPDDLEEKKIYFGIDDDPNPDDDNSDDDSILKTCKVCNGDRKCTYCRGKGTDGITGGDCAVCFNGTCPACNGTGHE